MCDESCKYASRNVGKGNEKEELDLVPHLLIVSVFGMCEHGKMYGKVCCKPGKMRGLHLKIG